jgi:hypothetical protein
MFGFYGLTTACSEGSEHGESRPTIQELHELFEHLCTLREQCGQSWSANDTVPACTDTNVAGYGDKPTHCLNDVVEYYECVNQVGDEGCPGFLEHVPPFECADLLLTAENECPPGTGF